MRGRLALVVVAALAIAACGTDDEGGSPPATSPDASAPLDTAAEPPAALPAECVRPPFTVTAVRDGLRPAGATEFEVMSTAGLQVPLVPNADESIPGEAIIGMGADAPLVGYVIIFGDEPFTTADVSLFGGYAPEAVGKVRGAISVFPGGNTPLAVGQTVTPAPVDIPNLFTTLNRVTLDLKASPDEVTMYLAGLAGEVTILGLTDTAVCFDVDLRWDYTDGGAEPDGTLTVKGIFTAELGPRSLPLT